MGVPQMMRSPGALSLRSVPLAGRSSDKQLWGRDVWGQKDTAAPFKRPHCAVPQAIHLFTNLLSKIFVALETSISENIPFFILIFLILLYATYPFGLT